MLPDPPEPRRLAIEPAALATPSRTLFPQPASPAPMSETGARKWIITLTVILASLIELIDTSIVNVALPQMMGNLGATLDEIAWVVTGYVVANVIVIPMTAFLAALFGRRNYFVGSIILVTVASFFCGHAVGLWELVTF